MTHIQFSVNCNTGECFASFGNPFEFTGPLCRLPYYKDGKRVIVVGLTPYTEDVKVSFPYQRASEAQSICAYREPGEAIQLLRALPYK